ncbi:MAG: hypothetical protein NC182_00135 [Prevotella sp.]|nr:hypothetical protein [Staphylococcus sp.]MCM1349592.1 hypothetical protein [Prevotella sp.]
MKLKKSLFFVVGYLFLIFITSCSGQTRLTHLGSSLGTHLQSTSKDVNGNTNLSTKVDTTPSYFQDDYLIFDGKQSELNIFLECTTGFMEASYLESIYNPFSEHYVAADKRCKQEYHRQIEKKYNISIQYINGGDVCDLFDGPATYERALASGKIDSVYAVITNTLLKPGTISSYPNPSSCGFGNANYYTGNFIDGKYTSLYDLNQGEGFFKDVQYVPDQLKQDVATYFDQIYMYIPQKVYNLDFLYYPIAMEKDYSIHAQYQNGNWNYETIQQWMEADTSGKWDNGFFPYTHAEEYIMGLFATHDLPRENVFDIENEDVLHAYLTYSQYGSNYEFEFFRTFQSMIHSQSITDNIEKYEAIPFPSYTQENTLFISGAPGYAFPVVNPNHHLDSETVFKIIYELEDGYRYQSDITDDEKMQTYLEQYLTEASVELVLEHQENVVFCPYTQLLEAICVMADSSTYYYLGKIVKDMASQNVQSVQEVKAYLSQLTCDLMLIDSKGGYVDFKGTYFELCQYYFNLIFGTQYQ